MKNNRANELQVATPQGPSGSLRWDGESYFFHYAADMAPEREIVLNMPWRAAQYLSSTLFPIFEMNLPEGYVLEQLQSASPRPVRWIRCCCWR